MPIARAATITHTLVNIVVDIPGAYMLATFDKQIDGQGQGAVQMRIDGAAMWSIIAKPGAETQTLGDAITDAVYAHAIETGAIGGAIVQPVGQLIQPTGGF